MKRIRSYFRTLGRKLFVRQTLGLAVAFALASGYLMAAYNGSPDPCAIFPNQSVAIALATATTAQLIAAPVPTNASIYICSANVQLSGSTPALTLRYGTGATPCATASAALTGTFGSSWVEPNQFTHLVAAVNTAVCAVTTGGPSNGYLTYVIEPRP